MKLSYLDRFADWLMNTPLLELAQARDRAIDKIENLSKPLNEHLFKLYVMQKSSYREHWTDEIDNFLNQANDVEWGKKRHSFEFEDYKKWMFQIYFFDNRNELKINLKRTLSNLLKTYESEEKINWSLEEFIKLCESFYDYFSSKLEKHKYNFDELEKYLEERFKF
jgi:hypothetical protein